MNVMNFKEWLGSTEALQRDTYGLVPADMREDERLEYLKDNVLAAFVETGEFLQSLNWKPWGRHDGDYKRMRYDTVDEIVDVLHFWANIMVALAVSPEELSVMYKRKQRVNAKRQERGYEG